MRNGELVRMSKRAGTFVTLRDLLDEVGPDVVRFTMLTRKNDAAFDFDLVKATEQSRDNPVWYVQYANARTHSVVRQAAAAGIGPEALSGAVVPVRLHSGDVVCCSWHVTAISGRCKAAQLHAASRAPSNTARRPKLRTARRARRFSNSESASMAICCPKLVVGNVWRAEGSTEYRPGIGTSS